MEPKQHRKTFVSNEALIVLDLRDIRQARAQNKYKLASIPTVDLSSIKKQSHAIVELH